MKAVEIYGWGGGTLIVTKGRKNFPIIANDEGDPNYECHIIRGLSNELKDFFEIALGREETKELVKFLQMDGEDEQEGAP